MIQNDLIRYPSLQKATDHALWLTFLNRVRGQSYGAILSIEGDYLVVAKDHPTFVGEEFEKVPKHYKDISFRDIRQLRQDCEQLPHWEELLGIMEIMDGELLRFILHYRVNLERFIRYELTARGFDKDHHWCGFEKAKKIWFN